MSERLALRRHLYEQLAGARPLSRARRALLRQVALLAAGDDDGDGPAGVREPRRPSPRTGPGERRRDG